MNNYFHILFIPFLGNDLLSVPIEAFLYNKKTITTHIDIKGKKTELCVISIDHKQTQKG